MSEKRFEKGYDDKGNALFIYDNQTDKMYYLEGAINLLNSLNDELEDSSAFIIEQRKENKGLREENEQLKKKLDYFQKRTIDLGEQLDYAKDENIDLKFALQTEMSENRYKCPRCKSPLTFHHEDKETITFECTKCKYLVRARKC